MFNNEPIMGPEEQPEVHQKTKHVSHFGLIIGVLIVALALVFIGLYTWSQLLITAPAPVDITPARPTAEENNEPESTTAEARQEILQVVSTSDELSAIEADLEATSIADLEAEFSAIEAELGD